MISRISGSGLAGKQGIWRKPKAQTGTRAEKLNRAEMLTGVMEVRWGRKSAEAVL